MTESYSPGPGVVPVNLLSQRDVGMQVPINYVTSPGVSITAACFGPLRYGDNEAARCISNLLAVGFRTFDIDLYWDQGRQVWSLCPVALPLDSPNKVPGSTQILTPSTTIPVSLLTTPGTSSVTSAVAARQAQSSSVSAFSSTASRILLPSFTASSLGQPLPSSAPINDTSNEPLLSVGPYICTTTINLSSFTSQLLSYLKATENTIDANLLFVFLNIHASSSTNAPTSPAPEPIFLPESENMLGSLFSSNLSEYIYTPSNLNSDRANLNSSWYDVNQLGRPVDTYYTTSKNDGKSHLGEKNSNTANPPVEGIVSTIDGWPNEYYIEIANSKRVLLGWGSVDPQMAKYNTSADSEHIFAQGYIRTARTVIANNPTCFLRNDTVSLSDVNSSWVTDTLIPIFPSTNSTSDILSLFNQTSSTTSCGISSFLNITLLDTTAREDYVPYGNYSSATVWTWASSEPKSHSETDMINTAYRCATSNPDLSGRWVVDDCDSKNYAACQATNQRYNWTVTTYAVSYFFASEACPKGYTFEVPRTALENSYLTQAMEKSRIAFNGKGAWIDFNSLSSEGCWVTGGPNADCPYTDNSSDEERRRHILVPTVVGIILLILSAAFCLVKWAEWRNGIRRRNMKPKRVAYNGFIYEGVPS